MSLHDLSTTAASNTSIGGVNVGEGCDMSNLNNGIRALAADAKGALTIVATSGTDTYTATPAPACAAYVTGMVVFLRFGNANTVADPTINLNALGAKTIKGPSGSAIAAGDLNGDHILEYDGTNFRVLNLTRTTGAPTDAQYVTLATNGTLTGERVLTAGRGISLTDGGAGGAATLAIDPVFLRSYLAGLALSNNGTDANNDIDIAVGVATAEDQSALMRLSSALTKQLDAAWAVGTNQGGLDTGVKAISTTYHVWLIRRSDTGVVDVLFSTSATAPTMPTNYDQKRRIGAIVTDGSGNIRAFAQIGDEFMLTTPTLDVNTTIGTTASTHQLSAPDGIAVTAILNVVIVNSGNETRAYLSPLTATDSAPSLTAAPLTTIGGGGDSNGHAQVIRIRLNTSRQFRARAAVAGTNFRVALLGWIDRRGRDD